MRSGIRTLGIKLILSLFLIGSTLFGTELDWSNDYKAVLAQAKKENKQIYMLITSENCRWCRKFEATTLIDEDVLERLENKYILLHISRDKDYMPEKFKSKRVPRHYFLTSEGQVIYTFLGYWNILDFNSFIDDVEIAYKKKFKGKQ